MVVIFLCLQISYVQKNKRIAELEKQVEEYEYLKKKYPAIIPSLVLANTKTPKELDK